MNLLLDTHALLWFALGDPRLTSRAEALILDPANRKFVSPASYWEIAIKESVRKYQLHVPHDTFFEGAVQQNGFSILPIEPRHTAEIVTLPHHHKDPFDRLIIAQAVKESMLVISIDVRFDQYPVRRLW